MITELLILGGLGAMKKRKSSISGLEKSYIRASRYLYGEISGCRKKKINYDKIGRLYLEAYIEALKIWMSYMNYKGDKRKSLYKILRDKADFAREEILWMTPEGSNLPNFTQINDLYWDKDLTDFDGMKKYIFDE